MGVSRNMIRPVCRGLAAFFLPAFVMALLVVPVLPTAAQQAQSQTGATDADRAARDLLAAAQAKLAFNLIEKVAGGPAPQATVSPASLAAALNLVSIGADAKMKEAIAKALGFVPDRTDAAFAALEDMRDKLAHGGDTFVFADRIVFAPANPPNKFMQAGLDKFGVPYSIADLSSPEEAAKVDAWVKDVTKGAIPEILGGPVTKASFAALNALHFKSRWKAPFDPQLTAPALFTGVDGKSAAVAMMRLGKATRAFRQERVGERNFL